MSTWRNRGQGLNTNPNQFSNSSMNNRNALFGNRAGSNGSSHHKQTTSNDFSDQTQRLYEEQNDREIDTLGTKISSLKHIALDIGREVQHHNSLLDGMEGQMGSVGQLMGGALSKLNEMMAAGGSKHMCYLILGVVGILCLLYLMLSWK